jgi:hypothetical protein
MPAKRINVAKLANGRTITPRLTGMRATRETVAAARAKLTDKPGMLALIFRALGL